MQVMIQFIGPFREYIPENFSSETPGILSIEYPQDSVRVKDVLESLGLSKISSYFPVINGIGASKDSLIKNGDTLSVYPHVAGG